MNLNIKIIINVLFFICGMFAVELASGSIILWAMVNLLSMESAWVSAHGVLSFHLVQLIFRYIFMSPIITWYIFNKLEISALSKMALNIFILLVHAYALGLFLPGVWRVMLFQTSIAPGVSVWGEIIITSMILGVLFERQLMKKIKLEF